MEEDAEGVHLNEAVKGRAAGIAGEEGGGGAQAGAEDGEEGQHLAIAREGLQEHQQDAEGAPDGFGEDADQVVGARDHGRVAALSGEIGFGAPAVASCGNWRCIWSRTFWDEAAKRRVKNGEPMPIHNVITAMATRIQFSRGEAAGKVRFFSTVTSPKKTRW